MIYRGVYRRTRKAPFSRMARGLAMRLVKPFFLFTVRVQLVVRVESISDIDTMHALCSTSSRWMTAVGGNPLSQVQRVGRCIRADKKGNRCWRSAPDG